VTPTEQENDLDAVGTFLYELSFVELTQPDSLCQRVEFDGDIIRVHLAQGSYDFAPESDRMTIARSLGAFAAVVDPSLNDWAEPSSASELHNSWVSLLRDLGVWSAEIPEMTAELTPGQVPWKYKSIERFGASVQITVTDGIESRPYEVSLDPESEDYDCGGVPVDIGIEIVMHERQAAADDRGSWQQRITRLLRGMRPGGRLSK